jgi:uncharacterized protein involved in outer membrane biogenesis
LAVDLAGQGRQFGSLASNLGGSADFSVQNGSFPLFGIAEVATGRVGETPQTVLSVAPTQLGTLSTRFAFSGGMAHLEAATITTPALTAEAKGSIGLLDGRLSLNGSAIPAAQGAAARPVPFTIEGTLIQPQARALAFSN